jgi:subtilisin family serine protease
MKTLRILAILITLSVITDGNANAAVFWYGVDDSVSIAVDSTKLLLKFRDGFGADAQAGLLGRIGRIQSTISDQHAPTDFSVCTLTTGVGYLGFLDSLEQLNDVEFVEPYYVTPGGEPSLVGRQVCVVFDQSHSEAQVQDFATANGMAVGRQLMGLSDAWVLLNTPNSGRRCIEQANHLHTLPGIKYSHPDFSVDIELHSYNLYDYYSTYQDHTKKVIGQFNQASVWDFPGLTTPITVAVIDDGVAPHEDLPASRMLPGYDFAGGYPDCVPDGDPSPGTYEAHGMACAGIIGASHTTDPAEGQLATSGVISLDPHVQILPVKIFTDEGNDSGMTVSDLADAFGFAWTQGAHVISNSWGFTNPYVEGFPILNDAIEMAYAFGRGGRGCPIVFSSGNQGVSVVGYPARLEFCLSVGATDLNDYRWYYSQYGDELDLVAPSDNGYTVGVWSLDQMGGLGWNPAYMSDCPPTQNDQNYDCRFGGTSAACPLVSGTAALLLSKDSTLSAAAVYYILRHSAETNLDWGTITPPHQQYGHGRLDAFGIHALQYRAATHSMSIGI